MTETNHTCPVCSASTERPVDGMCSACEGRTRQMLAEIVANAKACAVTLEPGRSGDAGSAAYGSKPPLNVTALDYAVTLGYSVVVEGSAGSIRIDRDGLGMLHEWERLIREERNLTPVALVPYAGSGAEEIRQVCEFLATHLQWACAQAWAPEMAEEVSEVHRAGMSALRTAPARSGRIRCPGDDPETGNVCGHVIGLPADFEDYLRKPGESAPRRTLWCGNCVTEWTVERLLLVAVEVYGLGNLVQAFGQDVFCRVLGIGDRQLRRRMAAEREERSA